MWILVSMVAGLAGLLFGYHTAVIAGALTFIARDFQIGTVAQEVVVTSILAGACLGATFSGKASDRWGPRPVLIAIGALFIAASVGTAWAPNFALLTACRTLLGLAVGSSSAVAPLYVAETAPPRWRGALVSMVQLAVTTGILLSYLVAYAFTSTGEWRLMLALGAGPAVLLVLGMLVLPESPRWLTMKGRHAEAEAARRRLDPSAAWEEAAADESPSEAGTFKELVSPQVRPVLVLAAGLFLFQNFSGIDGILYYAPELFKQVGFDGQRSSMLATAGLGLVNVLATVVALALVDRLGRRPLLIGGLVVMTGSLAMLASVLARSQPEPYLAVGCLAVYICAFALSLGPLPYVMMAEIFPMKVRGLGMSLASATSWGCNMLVSLTFLTLLEKLGASLLFWGYGGICLVALLFSHLLVPETRGCSLEDIEANLSDGLPPRQLGRPRYSDTSTQGMP